jgi:NADH-ubiquinone oxidoreductase chain 2
MGFFAKQFVLYSALQSGYYFISILAIIVSVISAFYYLRIIRLLHSDSNVSTMSSSMSTVDTNNVSAQLHSTVQIEGVTPKELDSVPTPLSNSHSFLISSLTLTILIFVLKPSILLNSTQLLSLTLFNF